MKKILLFVVLTSLNLLGFAQGVSFEDLTFARALEKAEKENKLVFIDGYTTWCGPCKVMDRDVFPVKEVGDYFNEHFVSLKIDMEKGEGTMLAEKYQVNAFPTFLFIEPDGKIAHRAVGGQDPAGLIAQGKIANNPELQLDFLQARYEEGERSLSLVSNYVKALGTSYQTEKYREIAKEFLKSMPRDQMKTVEGFTIVAHGGIDYPGEEFEYIKQHQSEIAAVEGIGKESVDYVLNNAVTTYLGTVAAKGSLRDLEQAFAISDEDFISPQKEMYRDYLIGQCHLAAGNFTGWFDTSLASAQEISDPKLRKSQLINLTYRVAVDPVFLEKKDLQKRSIEIVETLKKEDQGLLASYYCLANLYKVNGDQKRALGNLQEYMAMAKAQELDISRAEKLWVEIENMK